MTDVPGYRLEAEIGAGGMSTVYRATRIADGARVAVKVLTSRLVAGDTGYLRRLRTEAELAARVEHERVVRVHEVGGDGECAWLVMDLVSGPDLQRLVDEHGPLPGAGAAEMLAQAADAVSAVHAAGLVHRDLKPANIVLDGDKPMIADFGVARPVATVEASLGIGLSGGTDWAQTDTGRASIPGAGTVAYMAPEQWRGAAGDARTDVYALGGTLFTALTGRRPFPPRALPELAYAVAMSAPPAPSEYGAPVAFDPVVATAMAKDPDERYPDAATFAEAVRAAAAGEPGPAPGAGPVARGRSRRRWPALAATAAVLAIVAGGLLIWRPWADEPETVEKVVCANDITARDAPRSKTVVTTLRRDERLRVHRGSGDSGWALADLSDGRQGWVLVQFLGPPC